MSNEVDRSYFEIDGVVIPCNSIDEDIDPKIKPIEVMTRSNRGIGYAQGIPEFKLSCEVPMQTDSEISFEAMALSKQIFSAGVEYEGGGQKQYIDCVIDKVKIKSKSGDHVTYNIDVFALDMIET